MGTMQFLIIEKSYQYEQQGWKIIRLDRDQCILRYPGPEDIILYLWIKEWQICKMLRYL
jgi:hypothetical protein